MARGADLFILECFAYAPRPKFHLDFQTLSARRPDFCAKRTVLTHMSQDMLDHLDRVDVETAHDGMLIEVPRRARSRGRVPPSCALALDGPEQARGARAR